ncbi:hypothetical protein [Mycobacterium sp. GA-2829]|uniref:hypothetical protein n=1 Tax=Mycobacterium sp. GA-2829 TaxID=1772283 RepID=UPI0012F85E75|nr:hypothetical protein [Mycobacterium sp. GA-2829]
MLDNALRESGDDSFELPQRTRFNGPVASHRLRRSLALYVTVAVLGGLPAILGSALPWQALGLGVVLPGGGFLVLRWWAVLGIALTTVLFAVAFLLWFATGNVPAPVFIWLGAAFVAAGIAVGHPQPASPYGPLLAALAIVAVIAALMVLRRFSAVRRARRVRAERAAYLPAELQALDRRLEPEVTGPRELDDTQIGHLRWLLALGLRPVDSFDGFDVIEQFHPAVGIAL